MPRAGAGPRLVPLAKRGGTFYIVWSEKGRSRERSTGTSDRREAEIALAEFLLSRPGTGPVDPERYLITDALAEYALDRANEVMDRVRLAGAVLKLTDFFEGRRVSEVNPSSCRAYVKWRNRAAGTARRELTVLRAALNHAHGTGRLTRMVPVELPAPPPQPDAVAEEGRSCAAPQGGLRQSKVEASPPALHPHRPVQWAEEGSDPVAALVADRSEEQADGLPYAGSEGNEEEALLHPNSAPPPLPPA